MLTEFNKVSVSIMWARPYGSGYLAVSFGAGSSIVSIYKHSAPQKDTAAYPSRKSHFGCQHPGENSSNTCSEARRRGACSRWQVRRITGKGIHSRSGNPQNILHKYLAFDNKEQIAQQYRTAIKLTGTIPCNEAL